MNRISPISAIIRRSLLLGCLMMVCLGIFGQLRTPDPTLWEKISYKNGPYPTGRVDCLLQDHLGFMWVGSSNGLFRYDGYQFIPYLHDPSNPKTLSSDAVNCMVEDRNGNLWIGTFNGGLCRYNRNADDFTRFEAQNSNPAALSDNSVTDVCLDREGRLWVATVNGLNLAEPGLAGNEVRFIQYFHDPANARSLPTNHLKTIAQDSAGNIWIGTEDQGLAEMVLANGEAVREAGFRHFVSDVKDSTSLPSNRVLDLYVDAGGKLNVSTGYGISIAKPPTMTQNQLHFYSTQDTELDPGRENTVVNETYIGPDGQHWLVSAWGIHRYTKGGYQSFHPDKMGMESKGYNVLYTMLVDRTGIIWIGAQEGLYRSVSGNTFFHAIPMNKQEGSTTVTAIWRDHFDQLWLGFEDNGLMLVDKDYKPYARFRKEAANAQSLQNDFIMFVQEDRKRRIWVGTYGGGLHLASPERFPDGRIKSLKFERMYIPGNPESPLPDPYAYALEEGRDGRIWAGTFFGMGYYNETSQKFIGDEIYVANTVLEDSDGQIWVGSDRGIYTWNTETDTLEKYEFPEDAIVNLENDLILQLVKDWDGRIWAATLKGLVQLPTEHDPGKWYRTGDGLLDNTIRAIVVDGYNNLWVSTGNSLSQLDQRTGKIRNFGQADGILNERFAMRAAFRDKVGRIFFGGDNGVVMFHPGNIAPRLFDPPIVLLEFRLFNKPIRPGKKDSAEFTLPRNISLLDTVELNYADKVFSLEFAALDFRKSATLRYQYRMQEFDADWRMTNPGEHSVTYTNLNPGTYVFEVQAVNLEGQISWRKAQLTIIIAPPWWQTIWAWLLYGIAFVGLLMLILRLRIRAVRREMQTRARIEQARVDERDSVRASSSRDFHDEAGNKITRISLYLAVMRQQKGAEPEAQSLLDKMEENLQALSAGMRDFIWVLDPRHDNLPDLMLRLARFGDELFEHSTLRFQFQNAMPEKLDYAPDVRIKRHILLIFKEAMHNALRHSGATDVLLKAEMQGSRLQITLSDNGKGFDEAGLQRINGLQNMRDRSTEIGASLTVQSSPNNGTVWTLSLPTQ